MKMTVRHYLIIRHALRQACPSVRWDYGKTVGEKETFSLSSRVGAGYEIVLERVVYCDGTTFYYLSA